MLKDKGKLEQRLKNVLCQPLAPSLPPSAENRGYSGGTRGGARPKDRKAFVSALSYLKGG